MIRLFGFISFLAACAIAVSLLFGWVELSVFGMTLILTVISGWQLGLTLSEHILLLFGIIQE